MPYVNWKEINFSFSHHLFTAINIDSTPYFIMLIFSIDVLCGVSNWIEAY